MAITLNLVSPYDLINQEPQDLRIRPSSSDIHRLSVESPESFGKLLDLNFVHYGRTFSLLLVTELLEVWH